MVDAMTPIPSSSWAKSLPTHRQTGGRLLKSRAGLLLRYSLQVLHRRRGFRRSSQHRAVLASLVSCSINIRDQYGPCEHGSRAEQMLASILVRGKPNRKIPRVGDSEVVLYCRKHDRTERQNMTNHVYSKLACLMFALEAYASAA